MAVKELFTFILSDYQRYKGVMGGGGKKYCHIFIVRF